MTDTVAQLNAALAGRYDIEREIGAGGMATVYLARDLRHDRKVAVKVLRADLGAVLGVERFVSEIKVTANLQHPNLLPLFDSGEAGGNLFYVMPFVEGESLRARLDREKQLPVDEAIRIATSVASALDYAHRHSVIHRDLKPENILLHEGQPVVADFGIALAVTNAGGGRITQTGLSLGTPQYMSPEQATGDRVIDARTDIYSLGAVTYEMLTGEPPHVGATSQAIIARVLTEKPRSVRATRPSVPEHVELAVEHALEKLPADRFATATEFSEALAGTRTFAAPTRSGSTGGTKGAAVRARRREIAAWTTAALATLALIAGKVAQRDAGTPPLPVSFAVALPESVQLTTQGAYGAVALSRDGSVLVFQGMRGTQRALYARRLDDPAVTQIRNTEGGTRPVISPDGTDLLFKNGAGLRRVPLAGGSPRTVADSGDYASWGDAHQIVYDNHGQLWMVSEDGGPARLLAKPDTTRNHRVYGRASVLPGGHAALFTIWRGANARFGSNSTLNMDSARLGIVAIPSGTVTDLGIPGTFPHYSEPGYVFFATRDNWLMAVPFSLRSLQVTGQPYPVAEGVMVGSGGAAAFAVSQSGVIAYVGGDTTGVYGARDIVAVTRAGVARPLGPKPAYYQSPRVSPDGKQVAVTIYTEAGPVNQTEPNPDLWR